MSDVWYSERGRQARHKLLSLAAESDDPEGAEMAREILSGRVEFRDILSSSAYSEILLSRLQLLADLWDGMSESERTYAQDHADQLLAEAISAIENLPDEPVQTEDAIPPKAQVEDDDEDFEQHTGR
jgi:hypothetical protein